MGISRKYFQEKNLEGVQGREMEGGSQGWSQASGFIRGPGDKRWGWMGRRHALPSAAQGRWTGLRGPCHGLPLQPTWHRHIVKYTQKKQNDTLLELEWR